MGLRLIILSLLLLNSRPARASSKPEAVPQDLTYCQLVKDPLAFSGKLIRMRAIYSYMFEISRLKSPACCSERDVSIWVDFDENLNGISKWRYHRFPKGMGTVLVVFVGRIETGRAYGTGQNVRLVVNRIEKLEEKAKAGANQNLAWVPKDCKALE